MLNESPDISENHHALSTIKSPTETSSIQTVIELIPETSPIYIFCKNKSELNLQNENGWTPIYRALTANNLNALTELLNMGADPNIGNNLKETPLYHCVETDNLDGLMILLNYNANCDIQKSNGMTPLHLATKKNKNNFIAALLRHGANPNIKNKLFQQTSLHLAVINKQNEEMFHLFKENKGQIYEIKDKYDKTPFDYAKEANDIAFVNMLIQIFGPCPGQKKKPGTYSNDNNFNNKFAIETATLNTKNKEINSIKFRKINDLDLETNKENKKSIKINSDINEGVVVSNENKKTSDKTSELPVLGETEIGSYHFPDTIRTQDSKIESYTFADSSKNEEGDKAKTPEIVLNNNVFTLKQNENPELTSIEINIQKANERINELNKKLEDKERIKKEEREKERKLIVKEPKDEEPKEPKDNEPSAELKSNDESVNYKYIHNSNSYTNNEESNNNISNNISNNNMVPDLSNNISNIESNNISNNDFTDVNKILNKGNNYMKDEINEKITELNNNEAMNTEKEIKLTAEVNDSKIKLNDINDNIKDHLEGEKNKRNELIKSNKTNKTILSLKEVIHDNNKNDAEEINKNLKEIDSSLPNKKSSIKVIQVEASESVDNLTEVKNKENINLNNKEEHYIQECILNKFHNDTNSASSSVRTNNNFQSARFPDLQENNTPIGTEKTKLNILTPKQSSITKQQQDLDNDFEDEIQLFQQSNKMTMTLKNKSKYEGYEFDISENSKVTDKENNFNTNNIYSERESKVNQNKERKSLKEEIIRDFTKISQKDQDISKIKDSKDISLLPEDNKENINLTNIKFNNNFIGSNIVLNELNTYNNSLINNSKTDKLNSSEFLHYSNSNCFSAASKALTSAQNDYNKLGKNNKDIIKNAVNEAMKKLIVSTGSDYGLATPKDNDTEILEKNEIENDESKFENVNTDNNRMFTLENGMSSFLTINSKKTVLRTITDNQSKKDLTSEMNPLDMINQVITTNNSNVFNELQIITQNNNTMNTINTVNNNQNINTEEDMRIKITEIEGEEKNNDEISNTESVVKNKTSNIKTKSNNNYDDSLEYSKSKSFMVGDLPQSVSFNSGTKSTSKNQNQGPNLIHHRQISYHHRGQSSSSATTLNPNNEKNNSNSNKNEVNDFDDEEVEIKDIKEELDNKIKGKESNNNEKEDNVKQNNEGSGLKTNNNYTTIKTALYLNSNNSSITEQNKHNSTQVKVQEINTNEDQNHKEKELNQTKDEYSNGQTNRKIKQKLYYKEQSNNKEYKNFLEKNTNTLNNFKQRNNMGHKTINQNSTYDSLNEKKSSKYIINTNSNTNRDNNNTINTNTIYSNSNKSQRYIKYTNNSNYYNDGYNNNTNNTNLTYNSNAGSRTGSNNIPPQFGSFGSIGSPVIIPYQTSGRLRDWLISCDLLCYYNLLMEKRIYDIDKYIFNLRNKKMHISFKDVENLGIKKPGHALRFILKLYIDANLIDNNISNYIIDKFNGHSNSPSIDLTISRNDIKYCGFSLCGGMLSSNNLCNNKYSKLNKKDIKYNDIISFLSCKDLLKFKENFIHNGFDQIDYILIQLFSEFKFNSEILSDWLHIYADKDKRKVLEVLYDEKMNICIELSLSIEDTERSEVFKGLEENGQESERKLKNEDNGGCNLF